MAFTTFTSGTKAKASEVNGNFTYVRDEVDDLIEKTFILKERSVTGASTSGIIGSGIALKGIATEIQKTTDWGSNWVTKKATTGTLNYFKVCVADSNYIVAYDSVTAATEAYYSTDAGENWTAITFPAAFDNTGSFGISNTGRIFAIYRKSADSDLQIDYTDNGGTNWSALKTITGTYVTGVTSVNAVILTNNIMAFGYADSNDTSWAGVTVDGGSNWTEKTTSPGASISFICGYIDADNYWICFIYDAVIYGATWILGGSESSYAFDYDTPNDDVDIPYFATTSGIYHMHSQWDFDTYIRYIPFSDITQPYWICAWVRIFPYSYPVTTRTHTGDIIISNGATIYTKYTRI